MNRVDFIVVVKLKNAATCFTNLLTQLSSLYLQKYTAKKREGQDGQDMQVQRMYECSKDT